MRLGTDYDSDVLTASTTITITIHFVLHVVSAEFQTSKSEARHWRMSHKLPILDSYLHNLPNSANKYLYYLKQWKYRRFQITKTRKMFYIINSDVMQVYLIFIDFWTPSKNCGNDYWIRPVCLSVGSFGTMEQLIIQWPYMKINIWEFFKNLLRKLNSNENLFVVTVTLHDDLCSFIITPRSIFLQ